jgi:hypothetical protein
LLFGAISCLLVIKSLVLCASVKLVSTLFFVVVIVVRVTAFSQSLDLLNVLYFLLDCQPQASDKHFGQSVSQFI